MNIISYVSKDCIVTLDSNELLNASKMPELASIQYALHLFKDCNVPKESIMDEMRNRCVPLPSSLDIEALCHMNANELPQAYRNGQIASSSLLGYLRKHNLIHARNGELLVDLQRRLDKFNSGGDVEACNFVENGNGTNSLTLAGAWMLRHIIFDHGVPLVQVMNLWASYYYLIMHRPITQDKIANQTSIWNHIHRLHYIDAELEIRRNRQSILQRTEHGFRVCFYSSSDASQHHDRNRNVLMTSKS